MKALLSDEAHKALDALRSRVQHAWNLVNPASGQSVEVVLYEQTDGTLLAAASWPDGRMTATLPIPADHWRPEKGN